MLYEKFEDTKGVIRGHKSKIPEVIRSRKSKIQDDIAKLYPTNKIQSATWACACNTQSALWWDWNPFVRKLIKDGSLGENAKNKKKVSNKWF
jgi:hypothetical protein